MVPNRHIKRKDRKLFKNYQYKIHKISETFIEIIDEEWIFKFNRNDFQELFSLPYCNTAHASQGMTIREPYLIYEWNHQYATPEWLYVVTTRSKSLSDVYFMEYLE